MKKSIKILFILLAFLSFSNLFAEEESDFDWSQCWCNYNAGIEEGDWLLSVTGGLNYSAFSYFSSNYWATPVFMVELQKAVKIGKCPFEFGGYANFYGYGYKGSEYVKAYSRFNIATGAQASYHFKLPPEKLDIYGVLRTGVNIHADSGYTKTYSFTDWISFGTAIGGNYFFNDKIALNFEVGYPNNKVGLTVKF